MGWIIFIYFGVIIGLVFSMFSRIGEHMDYKEELKYGDSLKKIDEMVKQLTEGAQNQGPGPAGPPGQFGPGGPVRPPGQFGPPGPYGPVQPMMPPNNFQNFR